MTDRTIIDRRTLVAGSALTAVAGALVRPGAAWAKDDTRALIAMAVEKDKDANVRRLQEWIRHPGIAAENYKMQEACDYTMGLLKDAGFQTVKKMPTDGQPGIFATLDAGAKRTLGIYMMYDVKQVNPAEWSHPALRCRAGRQARVRQGRRRPRRDQPEGPGNGVPGRAPRHEAGRAEAAGQPRAGGRGRGGNRVAALLPGGAGARGDGGAEKGGGHHHPDGHAEPQRLVLHRARRQGPAGVPADFQRRKMGPRAEGRRPFQPARHGRQPDLAPDPGAQHAGRRRWPYPGDRRLVRQCPRR